MNLIPDLKFDKRRLQQVLINLLSNAIKHQIQGEIKVEVMVIRGGLKSSENFLKVSIKDQGVGIKQE